MLHKPEGNETQPDPILPTPAKPEQEEKAKPTDKSTPEPAKNTATAAAEKATAEKEQPWEMSMNSGLGVRRPTLPPRWVFPNVLSISTLLVIAVGAAVGTGAATMLLKNCPPSLLASAAAIGGTIAVGFCVRKNDPPR
ncbi:MAG: hypothetical protein HON53_13820 [Planctomycetaceae bacterium]|nr:hypothetical protein [Planctomycetaceae bacterium]